MTALPHTLRNQLVAEINRRVILRLRVDEVTRRMVVTALDARVYAALAATQNNKTGQLDIGLRALAQKAGGSRGGAADSTHRLRASGWIDWTEKLRLVGRQLRRVRHYSLAPQPPPLRPYFAPKAERKKERGLRRAALVDNSPRLQAPALSVEQQIALSEAWARESAARRGLTMR